MLEIHPAMAIGVMEDVPYRNESLQLEPGDTLFLYSDGVTEAMDAGENPYSEGRLQKTLRRHANLAPAALCKEILGDLELFVGRNGQSDDITMLALSFHGPGGTALP
jgi:sigma-B regulation protein RsbU (phosphoserine phosphatase)